MFVEIFSLFDISWLCSVYLYTLASCAICLNLGLYGVRLAKMVCVCGKFLRAYKVGAFISCRFIKKNQTNAVLR